MGQQSLLSIALVMQLFTDHILVCLVMYKSWNNHGKVMKFIFGTVCSPNYVGEFILKLFDIIVDICYCTYRYVFLSWMSRSTY